MTTAAFLVIAAGLVLYAILGGADAGIGVWLLASRRSHQPEQLERVLLAHFSPVWEANGLFLIFAVTGMFTAFPQALGRLGEALIPVGLPALALIVARGGSYMLAHHRSARLRRAALAAFAISGAGIGLLTGYTALALLGGVIHADGFHSGYLTSWNSFSSVAFAGAGMAYAGASAAATRTSKSSYEGAWFRRASVGGGVALVTSAVLEWFALTAANPSFRHYATGARGIALLAGLAGIAAAVIVQGTGRTGLGACVAAASGIAIGLGAALSALPYLAYPGVPLPRSGAGVPLGAYLGATAIGGPLLITALVLLYASVHRIGRVRPK
jgi:cytochrome d ubiquinol oxidase subunit II